MSGPNAVQDKYKIVLLDRANRFAVSALRRLVIALSPVEKCILPQNSFQINIWCTRSTRVINFSGS